MQINAEQPLGVRTLTSLCTSELDLVIIFSLQLFLMIYQEAEVPDVVQNQPIVLFTAEVAHLIRKEIK